MLTHILLLLVCLFIYQSHTATLSFTYIYQVADCLETYYHSCSAYVCIDSDGYIQLTVGANKLIGASPDVDGENPNMYNGFAIFGINGDLEAAPVSATAEFQFEIKSDFNVNVTYNRPWAGMNDTVEVIQLLFVEERDFVGSETCMWFPGASQGYFDGKFSFDLGSEEKFSFYMCGKYDFTDGNETVPELHGSSYGAVKLDLGPPIGVKNLQFFSEIKGYFIQVNSRRFYYGYSTILSIISGTGSCATKSAFIPEPRYSPLIIAVSDNATVPGSISGYIISADASKKLVSGLLEGSTQSPLDYEGHCIQGPEYRTKCLGLPSIPPSTTSASSSSTSTNEVSSTTIEASTTTVEASTTTVEASTTTVEKSTSITEGETTDTSSILLPLLLTSLAFLL